MNTKYSHRMRELGDTCAEEEPSSPSASDVVDLVNAAKAGDQGSWNDLVDRYLPLVTAVIARYRLPQSDADDVNQTVWLRLVEHLEDLREPRALPGWLATIARNESLHVIRLRGHDTPVDPPVGDDDALPGDLPELDENLIREEREHALREAMLELPPQRRELLDVADGRPPDLLRPDQRHAGNPQGKHRSDPGTRPGTAAPAIRTLATD